LTQLGRATVLTPTSAVVRPKFRRERLSVALQAANINKLPNWNVQAGPSSLSATGRVQPTELSGTYTVQVSYKLGAIPGVKVLDPELKRRNGDRVPHVYADNEPCIFRSKYQEWTPSDLISETIVPWISEWLESYEAWLVTGEWLGGGEHPETKARAGK
jgi:hypothetical protein